jgi:hypothetical protein
MPKPIAAKPPAVRCVPAIFGFQYCSDHTWQLPTSSTITVSGGEILFISAIIRRGSMGTSLDRSKGSQKLRQSARQPSISLCQALP